MARIRSVKPEFFRHEGLQDLEIANPGKYPMMVFEALWGHCDSKGRFEWKPRTLKLDILPFLPFEMAETLAILEQAGMLIRYTVDGKEYGCIDTFEKHQRLSGKEASEGERFPAPVGEEIVKQLGSTGEIPESQEWKGREEEGKGKENRKRAKPAFDASLVEIPPCLDPSVWERWVLYRRERKLSTPQSTVTAQLANLVSWATKGHDPNAIIESSIANGWQGLFEPKQQPRGSPTIHDQRAATIAGLTGGTEHGERTTENERDITGESIRLA